MTIITAIAEKPTAESKLGIAFSRPDAESPLVIKMVRDDGLFASSELKAGMLVESIMGVPMMFSTPKAAADALRLADAGEVVIKAMVTVGEITKTDVSQKLGISLKNSTTQPGIYISKISEDGLFAGSELMEGHQVLYINDVPCPATTKEAIALVKEAVDVLKIIAVPTDITPPTEEELAEQARIAEQAREAVPEDSEEKKDDGASEGEDAATESKGIIDKVLTACIC